MVINKMLSLSTYHLTSETFDSLINDPLNFLFSYYEKRDPVEGDLYGIFFPVYFDEDMPDDLKACVEFAINHDCDYIMFDGDVDVVEGLPVYKA